MPRFRRPRSPVHAARRVAAAVLAATALVLALRPSPAPAAARPPAVRPVVVAAGDLPAGTVLGDRNLAVARWPAASVPAGIAAGPEPLVGRVLAGAVRGGEPLTDVRLVGAALTDLLPEGQVAAPVRLADLAVTALVHTGDRVDVLATPPDAGRADVVAAGALVLAATAPAQGASADFSAAGSSAGLLLIAVDRPTAARLAAAATTATLTVTLPRP